MLRILRNSYRKHRQRGLCSSVPGSWQTAEQLVSGSKRVGEQFSQRSYFGFSLQFSCVSQTAGEKGTWKPLTVRQSACSACLACAAWERQSNFGAARLELLTVRQSACSPCRAWGRLPGQEGLAQVQAGFWQVWPRFRQG